MSALALKLLACLTMLLDHIGYCRPWLSGLRVVGRLSFPLYVFLLTEGFLHSSCRWKYALRLLLFALIAQVPFGLMIAEDPFFCTGNVMWTLLAAFLVLWGLDSCKKPWQTALCLAGAAGLCLLLHRGVLRTDYGARGILLALSFRYLYPRRGLVRGPLGWAALTLAMLVSVFYPQLLDLAKAVFAALRGGAMVRPTVSAWTRTQLYGLLTVPLLVLYNGRRGWRPASRPADELLRYGFYLFYPVHMLVLYWTIRL